MIIKPADIPAGWTPEEVLAYEPPEWVNGQFVAICDRYPDLDNHQRLAAHCRVAWAYSEIAARKGGES